MASYHFIGGDGRRYGPYDANQMRKFLAENRLTGQSRVSIDGGIMRPAAEFPEIMGGSPAGMAAGPPSMMTPQVHPESVIKGPTLGLIISSGIGVFG